MDFKQLQSFTAVVKHQSFTKAAEKLFLSQPTVSAHVSALEEELGKRLILRNVASITDTVQKGETIAVIETAQGEVPVEATLTGLLRGLIGDGYPVTKGFKIADIDPRADEYNNCVTVSDKARCIAGGALEAILHLKKERKL